MAKQNPISKCSYYFSYIVVVCYRDDGLSELIDTEIYKELEPHGIAHAKRFIVTIMALLRTLETNDFSFALALSMFKFLTFEATYRVWNIWVYPHK
jgi:hypothetical protein